MMILSKHQYKIIYNEMKYSQPKKKKDISLEQCHQRISIILIIFTPKKYIYWLNIDFE